MTSSLVVTTNNGIATVMLNRPDAFNALDLEMGVAMARHLVALGRIHASGESSSPAAVGFLAGGV
jgi:enoyl-CoA hydratase/carnithine racemase